MGQGNERGQLPKSGFLLEAAPLLLTGKHLKLRCHLKVGEAER
jgi:hypothetical protein